MQLLYLQSITCLPNSVMQKSGVTFSLRVSNLIEKISGFIYFEDQCQSVPIVLFLFQKAKLFYLLFHCDIRYQLIARQRLTLAFSKLDPIPTPQIFGKNIKVVLFLLHILSSSSTIAKRLRSMLNHAFISSFPILLILHINTL